MKQRRHVMSPRYLRAAMKANKITQTALAQAVGLQQPTIRYYLTAPRDPGLRTITAIAQALGVRVRSLLEEVDGEPADCPVSAAVEICEKQGGEVEDLIDDGGPE